MDNISNCCCSEYRELWIKAHLDRTISLQELRNWRDMFCIRCAYMSETCRYGEELIKA